MKLLKMEPIGEMLKLTLGTGMLKGERPSSVLFLAQPESGKTESLEPLKRLPNVFYTNDITPKILVDDVFPTIDKGEVNFLVVPDILNCIEKNRSTRQRFMNIMKTLIEEGITRMDSLYMQFKPQYRSSIYCGLITGITTDTYAEHKRWWRSMGFLSRMVPFSYTYDILRVEEIMNFIFNEMYVEVREEKRSRYRKFKLRRADVKGDKGLFSGFKLLARELGRQSGGYGFRAARNLMRLAKANAAIEKRDRVSQKDIDKVLELSKWINYDFKII
jgi:hypothetical protein